MALALNVASCAHMAVENMTHTKVIASSKSYFKTEGKLVSILSRNTIREYKQSHSRSSQRFDSTAGRETSPTPPIICTLVSPNAANSRGAVSHLPLSSRIHAKCLPPKEYEVGNLYLSFSEPISLCMTESYFRERCAIEEHLDLPSLPLTRFHTGQLHNVA